MLKYMYQKVLGVIHMCFSIDMPSNNIQWWSNDYSDFEVEKNIK